MLGRPATSVSGTLQIRVDDMRAVNLDTMEREFVIHKNSLRLLSPNLPLQSGVFVIMPQ